MFLEKTGKIKERKKQSHIFGKHNCMLIQKKIVTQSIDFMQ